MCKLYEIAVSAENKINIKLKKKESIIKVFTRQQNTVNWSNSC